jgi:hypothetical protein
MTDPHWISKSEISRAPKCLHANYTQIEGKACKNTKKFRLVFKQISLV